MGELEFGEDVNVFQGGGIAGDVAASRDFFEESSHNFSTACFREGFGEIDIVGLGDGSNGLTNMLA